MKILANRVPYLKPDIIEKFSTLTVLSEDGYQFQFNALVLVSWSNFWKNLFCCSQLVTDNDIEKYVVYTNLSRSDVNLIRSFVMRGVLPCSEEDITNGKLSKIMNKKFLSFGIDLQTIIASIHSKLGTESNPLMRSGASGVGGVGIIPATKLFKHSIFGDSSDYPNIQSSDYPNIKSSNTTSIQTFSKSDDHEQIPTESVKEIIEDDIDLEDLMEADENESNFQGKTPEKKSYDDFWEIQEEPFKQQECNYCGKIYFHEKDLKSHMVKEHNNEDDQQHYSDKDFEPVEQPKEAKKRKKSTNLKYKCQICEQKCDNMLKLQRHMKWCEKQKEENCKICGKMFSNERTMRNHFRIVHVEKKLEESSSALNKDNNKNTKELLCMFPPNPRTKCNDCGKLFTSKDSLKIHSFLHMSKKPAITNTSSITNFEDNETIKIKTEPDFPPFPDDFSMDDFDNYVSNCKKKNTVKDIQETAIIKNLVKDKSMFMCEICLKICTSRAELLVHEQEDHTKKVYPCEFCPQIFNLYDHWTEHIDVNHKDKPCNLCGKVFQDMNSFTKHQRHIHKVLGASRDNKEVCIECGKKCDSKTTLTYHMETVHGPDQKIPCDFEEPCEKTFRHPDLLLDHKKHDHYKAPCDVCGKMYPAYGEALKKHKERVHSVQERNEICHICSKSFTNILYLKSHINTHTGDKPFECRYCAKGFANAANTRMHERTVHEGHKRIQRKRDGSS